MKVRINRQDYDVTVRLHSGEVVYQDEVIGKIVRNSKKSWSAKPNQTTRPDVTNWDCDTRKNAACAVLEEHLKGKGEF